MANPVTWFEIVGGDGVELQSFYKDIFDWEMTPPVAEMGNYSMIDSKNEGIAGGIGAEMPGSGARVTVYIQVDDPQAYLDKVTSAGGTLVMPVTEVAPEVTIAMFTDPKGNLMGLLKAV